MGYLVVIHAIAPGLRGRLSAFACLDKAAPRSPAFPTQFTPPAPNRGGEVVRGARDGPDQRSRVQVWLRQRGATTQPRRRKVLSPSIVIVPR